MLFLKLMSRRLLSKPSFDFWKKDKALWIKALQLNSEFLFIMISWLSLISWHLSNHIPAKQELRHRVKFKAAVNTSVEISAFWHGQLPL